VADVVPVPPRAARKQTYKVRPEDALGCTIEVTGIFGFDLETVSGREEARVKMLHQAEAHIDAWLESVEVVRGRES
jgi:hypothetical protein